ncbi:DNA topoisomerase II, A subunit (plasmid) [Deferribacter desulfuricans SSM1]|uniref:DNA topoisomerase (ATP-hydrolyzing) n=1 Tax=Deferribacter desulfuricans (strain DSM 14783 / JCM 11476 / NBRC 101012 / SSM1) TaxID=639282 RepID=D3PF27_DEFDS|nr:DNA topoisomerase (ATP-hydrolyzing) [Deferribacter desulfuricans]BAI81819.1 DNA topoisomerase II, A subunit [Deferribacter desulfuricans SSM1]
MIERKSKTIKNDIVDIMKHNYIDYAMSVIIGRSLPDIRDGLKPVQRRILYDMYHDLHNTHEKPYKKSARIVGDVIGKYHPHGDAAVYDTIVRMAQDFVFRYPLIDGQGNFGSIDGDSPAAMRYTEIRMTKIAEEMLKDIDKDTVDFIPNYDGSLKEPTVLPTKLPNLLINGTNGIAVGMATNIPPHNLKEVIKACLYLLKNERSKSYLKEFYETNSVKVSDDIINQIHNKIMTILKAPDFPTGGIIINSKDIPKIYRNGTGSIKIKAKIEVNKDQIIITELPYMVNKSDLIIKIADLSKSNKIQGIADIKDESTKDIRIVIKLRKKTDPNIVLNQLYKYTQLTTTFSCNFVGIYKNKPYQLNILDLLFNFLSFRLDIINRRTQFLLRKNQNKLHKLKGLKIAVENIDNFVKIIKTAKNTTDATQKLMKKYKLDDIQVNEILNMRLQRLTSLEIEKLLNEYQETKENIQTYKEILNSYDKQIELIINELHDLQKNYCKNDKRLTKLEDEDISFDIKNLIPDNPVIIIYTDDGFIKKENISKVTKTGKTTNLQKNDSAKFIINTTNHKKLLLFTDTGKLYYLNVYDIPETGSGNSKGTHISNLIKLNTNDKIVLIRTQIHENEYSNYDMVCITEKGLVKRTSLEEYKNSKNGSLVLKLNSDDKLLKVFFINKQEENYLLMLSKQSKYIIFNINQVRTVARLAKGVVGMLLNNENDKIVDCAIITKPMLENPNEYLLCTITNKGFIKLTPLEEYSVQNRKTKGSYVMKVTNKTGEPILVQILAKNSKTNNCILITNTGQLIKIDINNISVTNRVSTGQPIEYKLEHNNYIVSATFL